MNDHTRIRLAHAHDAGHIARMSRDLIEHGLGWSWTPLRVRQCVADAQTNVIVAVDPRPVAAPPQAFAIMRYRDDDAHLLLLAVQPEHGRRGIGTAMVDWLEKVAVTAGVGAIALEARVTNVVARAFYARLGYVEAAVLPGYYQGREASVRMTKDLRPSRSRQA